MPYALGKVSTQGEGQTHILGAGILWKAGECQSAKGVTRVAFRFSRVRHGHYANSFLCCTVLIFKIGLINFTFDNVFRNSDIQMIDIWYIDI